MWRTLLVAACFILPALGQDSDDTERHFLEQSEVTFPLPVILKELEDVPTHSPAQRQLENPVRKKPSILFPLERPDTHNIGSVCQHLGQRETYPPGSLPSTGFSHLQRQADALRRMERSFAACCRKVGAGERLECALDGWKQSLDLFCSEEFSIKTRVHDCCWEREEEARHDCFALAAPPRSYLPPINASRSKSPACPPDGSASPDQDTDCDRGHRRFIEQSEVTFPLPEKEDVPAQSPPPWQTENPVRKKPNVLFPLERPDTHNIGSVCQHLGQRETYPPGSLPSTGFSHLQRQADALQRMERSFAACCRKVGAGERLECALDGWKQSLDLFCSEEFSIKTRVHDCCWEREEEARHDCFALAAPPRSYLPPINASRSKSPACPPDGSASPDQDTDCDRGHRRFIEQSEVTFPLPKKEDVPAQSPPLWQTENPVRKKPNVLFPLERPDTHNIGSVCQHLGQRETYPPGSLPSTGFSHLQRQADALQRMERSFAACCRKVGAGERLECALDGWKQSLDLFCSEEFSIKTRVHDCCWEREEEARHDCFALAAPPRSYLPPINASRSKSPACPPDGSASPDQDTDCDRGHRRFIEQSEVTFPLPEKEDVPAQSPPPWQTENPVRKKPNVLFPLERPDTHNIGSVCQHLGQRETYPPGSLPSTGFSHLQRQADALQRMERSFAACCRKVGAGERLECALDGWKQSLDLFCSEEFSIKTRVHDCCREREEEARHDCFALAAPPRSYLPRPTSPQVNFPPPQPDRGNIGDICRLQRFRLQHGLPSDPSGHRVRETGLVHSLESHYKECCLGHRRLQCALQKWSELLSSFCKEPGEAKGGSSLCCLKFGDKRDACFRESARFRNYDREVHTVSLAQLTEQTIDVLCRSPLRVASKGPQKLLVSKLRKNCCKLQTPESKVECGIREKTSFVGKACSRFTGRWRDHLDCCSQETASCFDTGYLAQVKLFAAAA